MKVKVVMETPVPAPIKKGDVLATLKIELPGRPPLEAPLVSGADVGQLGVFSRLGAAVKYVLWGESD